jgi:D-alanyl-D-alanine dipeptidase
MLQKFLFLKNRRHSPEKWQMNLRKSLYVLSSVLFFLLSFLLTCAQNEKPKKPDDLIDLLAVDSTIILDIRYATTNNFTKQKVYSAARCKLRREAAESLKSVQHELHKLGLGLKMYDGYRPLSVQKKFWEIMPDDRFVANPAKGSRHNRGAAVDLTLVDSLGNELEMPTPYDDFTEKAARNYMNIPPRVIANRALLEHAMTKHGYLPMPSEWWHFDFKGWQRFEIMDEPLE